MSSRMHRALARAAASNGSRSGTTSPPSAPPTGRSGSSACRHCKTTRTCGLTGCSSSRPVSAQLLSPEGNPEPWGDRRPLREAVAGAHRLVILGDPGSGKSTLVDWLAAWQLADAHQNAWKTLLGSRIPIPLILRDLLARSAGSPGTGCSTPSSPSRSGGTCHGRTSFATGPPCRTAKPSSTRTSSRPT